LSSRIVRKELDQLPGIRSTIDSGTAGHQRVYDFYNGLLDSAIDLFDTQARVVPDVTATQGGIAATEIFREDLDEGYVTVLVEMIAGTASSPELGAAVAQRIAPWRPAAAWVFKLFGCAHEKGPVSMLPDRPRKGRWQIRQIPNQVTYPACFGGLLAL